MPFFETRINVRLRDGIREKIEALYDAHKDKYDGPSHVVRVAINRLLADEGIGSNGRKKR